MGCHLGSVRAVRWLGTAIGGLILLTACGRVGFNEPCEGVECSGHGECVAVDYLPTCDCEPGYHAEDLTCVPDATACSMDSECDDSDVCTDDVCGPTGFCRYSPNRAACDDGLACTTGDACDGAGRCAGAAVDCSHLNAVCIRGVCSEAAGGCQAQPEADGTECGQRVCDGLSWSRQICLAGACGGTEPIEDCDDGEVCTTDTCDPAGGCGHSPEVDGSLCGARTCAGLIWGDPTCQAGTCSGQAIVADCDDANACTDDACDDSTGCSNVFNTAPCDDGDPCSMDDACAGGVCGGAPLDADGDGAVAAACGGADCDDGDPAVGPFAFEGPMGDPACLDGLDNDCDGLTDGDDASCVECLQDAECDDGNLCNGSETCTASACQAGTPLSCDDGQFCNGAESCDPQAGCQAGQPPCLGTECNTCQEATDSCFDPAGTACTDDGLYCTGTETCDGAGACAGSGDPCPGSECNTCQEATDSCFDPAGTACTDDGLYCTGTETCDGAGACAGSGDPCPGSECNTCQEATDSCFDPAGTACTDDGLYCTGTETCDGAGVCAGSGDPCPPGGTCQQCDEAGDDCTTPVGTACDDGLFCTGADECDGAGACSVHAGDPCPPGGPCDGCDEAGGDCTLPAGAPCDDGQACTHSDACDGLGGCAGTAIDCACHGDQCNTAACNPGTGLCEITPLAMGTACSPDGGKRAMYCQAGICTHWCNNSSEQPGDSDHECPADYKCSLYSDTDSAGFCEPNSGGTRVIGESCNNDNQCRSQYCDDALNPRRCAGACSSTTGCRGINGFTATWSCQAFEFGVGNYTHGFCNPEPGAGVTGDACSTASDCRDRFCPADSPRICRDLCCTESDCPASFGCWFEPGTADSFLKVCTDLGALGAAGFGEVCSPVGYLDATCSSGLCFDMGDGQDRCSRFCCRDADCPGGYVCDFAVAAGTFDDVRACRLPYSPCCPNVPADQLEADDGGNNAVYWQWGPLQVVAGPGSPEATGVVLAPGMVVTIEGTGRDNNDDGPTSEYVDVDSFAFNSGTAADIHIVLDVAGTSADLDVIITDGALTQVAGPGVISDGSADTFDGIFEEDFTADEQGLFQPGTDYVISVGAYTGSGGLPVDWQLTLCAK